MTPDESKGNADGQISLRYYVLGRENKSEWPHDTSTGLHNNGDFVARQLISFNPSS